MNANNFSLAQDIFMLEMHLKQPRFTSSANKEIIQKLKKPRKYTIYLS